MDDRASQHSEQAGSLRERLRRQAELAREQEQRRAAEDEEAEQFYDAELLPRMLAAASYFESIVADLNTIAAKTTAMFPIGPSRDRNVPFLQHDYTFFVDDRTRPREVAVNCVCELSAPVVRHVASARDGDEFEAYLRDMGIQFHRRRQLEMAIDDEEGSRFTMEGGVNAGFKITVDLSKRAFNVVTRNLETEPRRSYVFTAEKLQEPLFEGLGGLVLRESGVLVKSEVSTEVRERLRAEHEREEKERARLLALAEAEREGRREGRLDRKLLTGLSGAKERVYSQAGALLRKRRKR